MPTFEMQVPVRPTSPPTRKATVCIKYVIMYGDHSGVIASFEHEDAARLCFSGMVEWCRMHANLHPVLIDLAGMKVLL